MNHRRPILSGLRKDVAGIMHLLLWVSRRTNRNQRKLASLFVPQVQHFFDGTRDGRNTTSLTAVGGSANTGKQRGISRRSPIGFLSSKHEVGDYLKTPRMPVWVLDAPAPSDFWVLVDVSILSGAEDSDGSVMSGEGLDLVLLGPSEVRELSVRPNHLLRAPGGAGDDVTELIRGKWGARTGVRWVGE